MRRATPYPCSGPRPSRVLRIMRASVPCLPPVSRPSSRPMGFPYKGTECRPSDARPRSWQRAQAVLRRQARSRAWLRAPRPPRLSLGRQGPEEEAAGYRAGVLDGSLHHAVRRRERRDALLRNRRRASPPALRAVPRARCPAPRASLRARPHAPLVRAPSTASRSMVSAANDVTRWSVMATNTFSPSSAACPFSISGGTSSTRPTPSARSHA